MEPTSTPPTTPSRAMAPIYTDILDMVGNTPMLELNRLDTGPCRLLAKLECLNPGNSIKDRIALSMINAAEQGGQLAPGGHIVEATAGNTGIALALVGTQRGYKVSVVVPDKMSEGKISHLRAMGAEVIMARSDVEKGHPDYYQDVARRYAAECGGFFINQFSNEANVQAHKETTAVEIWNRPVARSMRLSVGLDLVERSAGCRIIFANRKVTSRSSWLIQPVRYWHHWSTRGGLYSPVCGWSRESVRISFLTFSTWKVSTRQSPSMTGRPSWQPVNS